MYITYALNFVSRESAFEAVCRNEMRHFMQRILGESRMTDTERRRIALLQQTRKIYSESYAPPAIHPRYRAAYQSLYPGESEEKAPNSFVLRLVIAIVLFGVFFVANQRGMKETETVANEIQQEFDGFEKYYKDW